MSYVDVETSAEAIQEDEELIEAVELIVEKAAEAIYTDIKNDVSGVYIKLLFFVQENFPFLIYWRENRSLFWEDMQKVAIFTFLFLISFLLLAPSKRWRRKLHADSRSWSFHRSSSLEGIKFQYLRTLSPFYSKPKLQPRPCLERSKSASSIDYRLQRAAGEIEDEFEETEEESFARRWPTVLETPHRFLVLPPVCKRVEKPKKTKEDNKKEKATKKQSNKDNHDYDNPANRLVVYTRNLLYLAFSFLRYDYVAAGWTLIHWVEACFRSRQNRDNQDHDEDDDDESDAGSLRSTSLLGSSSAAGTPKKSPRLNMRGKRDSIVRLDSAKEVSDTGETNDSPDDVSHASLSMDPSGTEDSEEKKETAGDRDEHSYQSPPISPLSSTNDPARQNSGPGIYGTPSQQEGTEELDPGEALAAKVLLHGRQPKLKDALQNYRNPTRSSGTSGTSGPALPPSPMIKRNVSNESTIASLNPELAGSERPVLDRNTMGQSAFYFEAANSKESLLKMKVEVPVPDKNGYILGDEFLPDANWTPLLVFVNSRSGPQQGHVLIAQLRGLLNPVQVWDLADGGPEEVLESFSTFTRLRILVCGGDGTVSWIVSTIENMKLQRWPPIAILPLGTGNDLARIHGWGGGYNNESLLRILKQVAESYISWLDRWEMTIENKKGKVKQVKSFFNYLGVGADAQAALQVHMLRESKPQLFFSRVVNKAWYGVFGAEDIIKATSVNLPHEITLIADGVEVPLPADSQGIILLNIDSYAGGVPLWANGTKGGSRGNSPMASRSSSWNGIQLQRSRSFDAIRGLKKFTSDTKPFGHSSGLGRVDSMEDISLLEISDEEKYERVTACDRPSSCQDGVLDIVSIRGAFHLGQIRVGLSNAQKLCQCREATIIIKRKVSVQIDGEPWRQNVCTLRVKRKKDAAIMLHRSADDSNGVETEMSKLLEWAEERKLIDSKIHAALMKEFSRRIETMTRERRVRSQDNLMFSLKRAMASSGNINKVGSNGIMF